MDNFEFYNPVHLIYGPGESNRLGQETATFGKKALLVSYKVNDFLQEQLKNAEESLRNSGVEVVKFYEAVANPTMTEVAQGVALAKAENVDVVIGFGGGSVMDSAKIIAAGVNYTGELWNMIVSRHDEVTAVAPESALPIILVPTIPATSSEMNCGAVVTNPDTKEKSYVFAPCLYAKVSILDPELTLSLPAYQTACGGVDAISHVMEVYLNGVDNTPLQDRLMEGLVINLMDHTKAALENPADLANRGHFMWESCVAWNGWTLPGTSTTTPMHMVAHPLSARYNITHGATLAIVMPAWMKQTYKTHLSRYIQFGERVFGMKKHQETDEQFALKVIAKFEQFLNEVKVQTRLSQCSVPKGDLPEILADIVRISFSAEGTLPARQNATQADIMEILELAF